MQHTLELSLRSSPEEAWAFLADTNTADAAAGLPAIAYRDEPQPDGTSRRFFSYRLKGLAVEGEEMPFTWEYPLRFRVERTYSRGPFTRNVHECVIEATATGCHAVHTFVLEPRGLLGRIFAWGFGRDVLPTMTAWFHEQDAADSSGSETPAASVGGTRSAVRPHRIEALRDQAHRVFDAPAIDDIARLIAESPDIDIERLRPIELARVLGHDLEEVLNSLLAMTQVGLTRLRWDVICPHCRGDKQNLDSLAGLGETAFCPSCNIDFDVDLDRAIEAVFVPHPSARAVEIAKYCLGGPGMTPHIRAQHLLAPGTQWTPTLKLPEGRYRLRFSGSPEFRWLSVEDRSPLVGESAPHHSAPSSLTVNNADVDGDDPVLPAATAASFALRNRSDRPVLAVLEETSWAKDALPAGRLVADQRFRELFANEMLAPGVRLAVESVTIMFTDLVGSTAMYGALGDAKAFNLVWTHFDVLRDVVAARRGALVKTIGDAIMAIFMDPRDALHAAADLHERLPPHLTEHGHDYPAALKVGMHTGPAIAVTLNERIDYFGTTVNLAARTEGQSEGDDIVITLVAASEAQALELLEARGWEPDAFDARVKGFEHPVPMMRFRKQG
ncbi:MAG: adenylate/guanylate cyclase domain-containing protein [Deltaproteobacteria bacterium]|nr:adenylate/guanylate cyclase domain-containing protein [Deltaproteobacteria bacterium]